MASREPKSKLLASNTGRPTAADTAADWTADNASSR